MGAVGGPAGASDPAGPAGPDGAGGPVGPSGQVGPFASTAPFGATRPEDADWAEARWTAAQWAESQLAAAGVSPAPPQTTAPVTPRTRRRAGRRAFWVLVALFLGLVLCSVIAAVSVTLGSGSSLRGGLGQSTFAPATVSAVAKEYRLGVGSLDVDLSGVTFPARGRAVELSVGIGRLTVDVPDNAIVNVDAHAGVGQVEVFGESGQDVQLQSLPRGGGNGPGTPRLTLQAHVGMGSIQVIRG